MEIYGNVELAEDKRADSGATENLYECVILNRANLEASSKKSKKSGGDTARSSYRLAVVCVVLLCVLLLTAITVLLIKYNLPQTSYNSLTEEKKQSDTSLPIKKDQGQRDGCLRTLIDLCNVRSFNSNLYVMSNEKKSWTESRQDCRNKGADLVIINSIEEQMFIAELLQGSRAWIGLSDRDNEGEWKWVDGTPTSKWAEHQPDNYGGDEDCAETGYPDKRSWNARLCSDKQGWICEKRN